MSNSSTTTSSRHLLIVLTIAHAAAVARAGQRQTLQQEPHTKAHVTNGWAAPLSRNVWLIESPCLRAVLRTVGYE